LPGIFAGVVITPEKKVKNKIYQFNLVKTKKKFFFSLMRSDGLHTKLHLIGFLLEESHAHLIPTF
jgi:hypothetical protein